MYLKLASLVKKILHSVHLQFFVYSLLPKDNLFTKNIFNLSYMYMGAHALLNFLNELKNMRDLREFHRFFAMSLINATTQVYKC